MALKVLEQQKHQAEDKMMALEQVSDNLDWDQGVLAKKAARPSRPSMDMLHDIAPLVEAAFHYGVDTGTVQSR